ncbi:hypothetical protein YC2023_014339 [Brassica napus]
MREVLEVKEFIKESLIMIMVAITVPDSLEWERAQSIIPKPINTKPTPRMLPAPTTDTIVCHTDAAWNKEHEVAGLAWICSTSESIELSRGSSLQSAVALKPCGGGTGDKRSAPVCIGSLLQTHLASLRFSKAYHSHQLESPTDRALRYSIGWMSIRSFLGQGMFMYEPIGIGLLKPSPIVKPVLRDIKAPRMQVLT